MRDNKVELMRFLSNKCVRNQIDLKTREYKIPIVKDEYGDATGGDKFLFELRKDGVYLARVIHMPTFEQEDIDDYILKLEREIDESLLQ